LWVLHPQIQLRIENSKKKKEEEEKKKTIPGMNL
jgi:hypothetical protein